LLISYSKIQRFLGIIIKRIYKKIGLVDETLTANIVGKSPSRARIIKESKFYMIKKI